jgi:deazaflavin-dependent oxidoreductase (nitroreductase family)
MDLLEGEYEPPPADWDWAAKQVQAYEASGGRENSHPANPDWTIVVITSRGASTGKLRKNPVMRVEKDGVYAAVASKGGTPENPSWYHNFVADPVVQLQDGPEPALYRARIATGEERAEWWARAVAQFPPYAEYQEKTDREIPLFLLEPISG